jgi:hypothetical protein
MTRALFPAALTALYSNTGARASAPPPHIAPVPVPGHSLADSFPASLGMTHDYDASFPASPPSRPLRRHDGAHSRISRTSTLMGMGWGGGGGGGARKDVARDWDESGDGRSKRTRASLDEERRTYVCTAARAGAGVYNSLAPHCPRHSCAHPASSCARVRAHAMYPPRPLCPCSCPHVPLALSVPALSRPPVRPRPRPHLLAPLGGACARPNPALTLVPLFPSSGAV